MTRRQRTGRPTTSTLGAFTVGALGSVVGTAVLKSRPPGGVERWTRTSYAGCPVTLFEGPAYAVGAVVGALVGGAGSAAAVAGLGAAAFGALDDLVGDSRRKGLLGHLTAAARGDITTGAVKVAGLGATGLVTAWMIDRSRERDSAVATLVGAAVIAGSANVVNLLDLRPGRALKVVLLAAAPIVSGGRGPGRPTSAARSVARATTSVATAGAAARSTTSVATAGAAARAATASTTAFATAGAAARAATAVATASAAAGAAVGAMRGDLLGRHMLGDTGANSAGAMLGTALVARTGSRGRLLSLVVVTALTLASERVSFTSVIESTPVLRELDALGRPGKRPKVPLQVDDAPP